jgi:hypothetical protein
MSDRFGLSFDTPAALSKFAVHKSMRTETGLAMQDARCAESSGLLAAVARSYEAYVAELAPSDGRALASATATFHRVAAR